MHLERQPAASAAQPGVVGHRLPLAEPQELAQRQAVGAAPFQAALAVDALEVADQQHAEVAPRRQRWPPSAGGVVGRAQPLDEAVEPGRYQARPAAGRRTRGPASVAAPTTPPASPTDDPAADPAPSEPATITRRRRNQPKPISSTGCYARRPPAWGYRHKTVCHARGEYARDEDGDGFCEIHVNTMEGTWSLLRSWLRPHRGISQEKLPLYLGFFEFVHNARRRGKALLGALVAALVV